MPTAVLFTHLCIAAVNSVLQSSPQEWWDCAVTFDCLYIFPQKLQGPTSATAVMDFSTSAVHGWIINEAASAFETEHKIIIPCAVCTNRATSASPWRWGPSPGSIWREGWCSAWSWSGGGRWPSGYRPVVPAARPVCAASPSNGGWCRPGTPPGRECRSARRHRRICEEWQSGRYSLLFGRDVRNGAQSQGCKTGEPGTQVKMSKLQFTQE